MKKRPRLNRREFLHHAGLAVAASSVAASPLRGGHAIADNTALSIIPQQQELRVRAKNSILGQCLPRSSTSST
ncbi:MAG: hypothetical protein EXR78_09555 [Deltaproteobacteria bacterium]|nr:hypothetical protein [Deltaproteobacteria bacterium]